MRQLARDTVGFTLLYLVLLAMLASPVRSATTAAAFPDGGYVVDSRQFGSLQEAVAAARGRTLVISSELHVTADLVIPRDVALSVVQGGAIVRKPPGSLTINASFEAGRYRVFAGFESGGLKFGPGSVAEIYPQWFGAVGDGTTDDAAAFNALATSLPTGTVNNYYVNGAYPTIKIPQGTYALATTWDLSYRNDLVILADGMLKWTGADDGTMVELKCSNRTKTYNLRLDGNRKAGTFIHQSGDGTSDGRPQKSRLEGKGNVSGVQHHGFYFQNQYPLSTKAMFDTIPYASDTIHTWYYSMDDSMFYGPLWRTGGDHGFCLSVGSSTISVHRLDCVAPNGIIMYTSSEITLYNPIFSLQANDKGAIYVVANAVLGDVALYSPYLEHTTKPLLSMDPAATRGGIGHVLIQGGMLGQLEGATRIIDIPLNVGGHITINDPKVQSPHGRRIYAPSCSVHLTGVPLGEYYRDYGLEIEKSKTGSAYPGQKQ